MSTEPFIHTHALVEPGATIAGGTRVWAFVHVLPGAVIGRDCNVCDHVFIENDVIIGDRVTIKCGIYLWDGITIENDVHLGPNVVFTNDLYPRSKQAFELKRTVVRRGASVGANATVLPGVTIGEHALIGAGSVVTKDVPAHTLVVGNPARPIGYVCDCGQRLGQADDAWSCRECGRRYTVIAGVVQPV